MHADPLRTIRRMSLAALGGAFCLVLAGGLVTSRDAGLAVPDWPLAFGQINPPGWWRIENVRTEHGHRILAFFVASWTAALLVRVLLRERNPLLRRLVFLSSGLVLLQAALGGLRVLELSVDLAMVHGVVGQVFFASLACIAAVTSPYWPAGCSTAAASGERAKAGLLLGLVAGQLLLGLFLRHLGAAARPLEGTTLFYAHVIGAGLVLSAVLDFRTPASDRPPLARWTVPLVLLQISLGIATWIATDDMTFDRQATFAEAWLPTLHVGVGALLLATAVVRNLYAWRHVLEPSPVLAEHPA